MGLGIMGGPRAGNLVKAGHDLTVFDLSESAVKALVDDGARTAGTVLEAVKGAEVVISMLPAGQHVETVYLGENGLLAHLPAATLVIDSSTISPETSRAVAAAARSADITFLDAPVSGGVGGARAGTLTFICGGEPGAFERAKPVLEGMGKNIFHAGPGGAGQMAKICNNMLLAIQMAGTAEALALGVKNGLDPGVLSEIMKQSSGGNWVLNGYNPWPGVMEGVPASRDYAGGFLVNLMTKDLGLAMENATANHSPIPMGALARNLYELHAGQGNGQLDFSSIQRFYRPDPD
jgi:3-hydroxyisobutyrate dehydrogenase